MEEEDDDFYAPTEDLPGVAAPLPNTQAQNAPQTVDDQTNGLEDGDDAEEVEVDESDSVLRRSQKRSTLAVVFTARVGH